MPEHQDYNVRLLLRNDRVRVMKVEIRVGGTIPRHSHLHDYTVVPSATGRIRKTTYRGDKVEKQEDIDLIVDSPYWIQAQGPDVETEVVNIGSGDVIFTKIVCNGDGQC